MAGDPLGYLATINGAAPTPEMAQSNQDFAGGPTPPPTDPTGGAQAAQQIGQTPAAQGVGGTLKHLLSSYFVGVGSKLAGVMTPEQKQQRDFNNQIQLRQQASLDSLRQSQEQANQLVPFQLPNGQTVMIPANHAATLGAAQVRAQASTTAANTKAQSVLDAIRAKGLIPKPAKPESRDDQMIRILQKQAQEADPTLTADEAYQRGFQQWVKETKTDPGVARARAFNEGKPVQITDPNSGLNAYIPAGQAFSQGAKAIAASSNLQKNAFTPKARFDDIARATSFVSSNVDALDGDTGQKALIAKALADPTSKELGAVHSFTNSELFKSMGPKSRDYVNGVLSLREQIMGANAMLTGAAGVSDSRVKAIWDTLPGLEADSDNARRKMVQVQGMINNLKEAFPQVKALEQRSGGQRFTDNGVTYNIPAEKIAAFKKAHPNAR